MKTCSRCKRPGEFYPNKKAKDGLQSWCKPCCLAHNRKRLYGIDDEQVALLEARGCEACGAPHTAGIRNSLHIDHDHESGRVRGALCGACNRALGYLKDDPDRILALLSYLLRTSAPDYDPFE